MDIKEAIQHCREVAAGYTEQGKCPECATEHAQLADWLEELEAYRDTLPMKRAQELAQAEQDGRLVVLPVGVTRAALENDLCVMEQQIDGDAVENYMTGYFKGHKTGRMGVLRLILGVPYWTRQEAEAAARKEETDVL